MCVCFKWQACAFGSLRSSRSSSPRLVSPTREIHSRDGYRCRSRMGNKFDEFYDATPNHIRSPRIEILDAYRRHSLMGNMFDEFFEATPEHTKLPLFLVQEPKDVSEEPPPLPPKENPVPVKQKPDPSPILEVKRKPSVPVPAPILEVKRRPPVPVPAPIPSPVVEDYSERLNTFFAQSLEAKASTFPSRQEFIRNFVESKYSNKSWREVCDLDLESSVGMFKLSQSQAIEQFALTQNNINGIPMAESEWPHTYTHHMILQFSKEVTPSASQTREVTPPVSYPVRYKRKSEISYLNM